MKTERFVEKLNERIRRFHFIATERSDCDSKIIAMNKNINDIVFAFSYEEENKIVYNFQCLTIGFYELLNVCDTIKNILGE